MPFIYRGFLLGGLLPIHQSWVVAVSLARAFCLFLCVWPRPHWIVLKSQMDWFAFSPFFWAKKVLTCYLAHREGVTKACFVLAAVLYVNFLSNGRSRGFFLWSPSLLLGPQVTRAKVTHFQSATTHRYSVIFILSSAEGEINTIGWDPVGEGMLFATFQKHA